MVRAWARRIIEHAHAGLFEFSDARLDIFDRVGDVVKALAFLLQERGNRTRRIGWLQQFETDIANAEEADLDLLVGDLLDSLVDRSESLLVERSLGLDGTD